MRSLALALEDLLDEAGFIVDESLCGIALKVTMAGNI